MAVFTGIQRDSVVGSQYESEHGSDLLESSTQSIPLNHLWAFTALVPPFFSLPNRMFTSFVKSPVSREVKLAELLSGKMGFALTIFEWI